MKIICPLPSNYRISALKKKGIEEFYIGFVPSFWQREYSLMTSINRRYADEEQHYDEGRIAGLIQRHDKLKFYIAFNAALYNTGQIGQILKILKRFYQIGLKGVILSDIGLIRRVRLEMPKMPIHLSCLAVCMNRYSVEFFRKLRINRIIFPRSVDVSEIKEMKGLFPDMTFEALIKSKDCLNIDGLCTHLHFGNRQQVCAQENRYFDGTAALSSSEDVFSRIKELNDAGVDFLKFPRRGDDQVQFLIKNNRYINFINKLNQETSHGTRCAH